METDRQGARQEDLRRSRPFQARLMNGGCMKDHISVCIATYRRNKMLERLLRKLANQKTGNAFGFSIVVVDNDSSGPAREIVVRMKKELGLDLRYGIETEQTIPAARNHALRLAEGNYIAIIDDDEFPPQDWLLTMYLAIKTFDVDGALGPVHPFFEGTAPRWLIRSNLCERPVHRTGTLLNWEQTRTGNVLLKRAVFDEHRLVFDLNFKTGGSDREFFRRAMHAGYEFIAVEEAAVYEVVPPERWDKRYYLNRALVNGYNSTRYRTEDSNVFAAALGAARSGAAILICCTIVLFVGALGSHVWMVYLEKAVYHLSRLAGMMGIELVKKRNF